MCPSLLSPSRLTRIPDGPIAGASGLSFASGLRAMPMCHSCGTMVPPASCTAAATSAQKYDYHDAAPDQVARAQAIARACGQHGTTLPAAAIAFPFTHPAVVNVTLGMRTPDHVARNVELYRSSVPGSLWADLREQVLIRSDVPA